MRIPQFLQFFPHKEIDMRMKLAVIGTAVAVALAGCAGGPTNDTQAAAGSSSSPQYNSGFLPDYTVLQPVSGQEGAMRYVDKSFDFRPYKKIMIDPVQIYLAPNPDYTGLQPDAIKRMTDAFNVAFRDAVASGYQIVTAPGPDVLRLRIAITGVQPVAPPLNPTDFIPIKAIFNAGRAAAGESPKLAQMAGEMQVLAPNGRQVAAATNTRQSIKTLAQGERITWADLQPITTAWGTAFRTALDNLRGVAPRN